MEKIKFKRWMPVAAAVAIQLCLGTAYIWSVFQNGVAQALFANDNASASLSFSLLLAMLSFGGVFSGLLQKKYSTRLVVIAGGLILGMGFIAASFVTASAPFLLWITYGVIGGIGMGFTYSTTIGVAQKWYPDKRGLITGIIVAALGLGGVVFTPLIEWLIRTLNDGTAGSGELKSFMVLGFIFIVVCTAGGLFMINPPKDYMPKNYVPKVNKAITTLDYSPRQMIKTLQFYLITVSMFLACMGGLMMIAFAKPIAVARNMGEAAVIGVLVISLFNSVGRLTWGWISDKLGRKNTIIILLAGTAVLSLLVNAAAGYMIFVLIGLIGFFYGGFLSNYPALTADYFGAKNVGFNYGIVLLGFGAGAVVSSYIAGYFKNIAAVDINKMFPAFLIASLAAAAAILLIALLKPLKQKQ
jgi:OFA family oxalate/formate antiporter-like MFS transporter